MPQRARPNCSRSAARPPIGKDRSGDIVKDQRVSAIRVKLGSGTTRSGGYAALREPIPATLAIGGMGAQRQPVHCPFGLIRQAEQVGPSGRYAFPFHSVQASSVCRFICSNKSWCLTYSCRKPVRTITRIIATSNNIAAKMK